MALYDYYNPGSNYGLNQDWKQAGLPTRPEFIKKVRGFDIPKKDQNKMIREFWGPGGQPAFNSPFGKKLADDDPVGTYTRMMGNVGTNSGTAFGRFGQGQYTDIYNAFRAAKQRNPLLRFTDFIKRSGATSNLENRYRMATPTQRGEVMPTGQQRWV